MKDKAALIAEASSIIKHVGGNMDGGAVIYPRATTKTDVEFKKASANAPGRQAMFATMAREQYMAARALLVGRLTTPGLYLAQQCIESYLKTFCFSRAIQAPHHHRLDELLKFAAAAAIPGSWLQTDEATVICSRFDPFQEAGRYPVYKRGPENGMYGWMTGEDELMLDYFVNQMELLLASQFSFGADSFPFQMVTAEIRQLFERDNFNVA